jgi:AraC-like DNA-binding protein
MSRRHFIRLFQQSAGMGFSDYLQHRRVELASRLLHETDYKISYIAKQAGYQDPAHFREVFNRIMGTTPNQYRKGLKI